MKSFKEYLLEMPIGISTEITTSANDIIKNKKNSGYFDLNRYKELAKNGVIKVNEFIIIHDKDDNRYEYYTGYLEDDKFIIVNNTILNLRISTLYGKVFEVEYTTTEKSSRNKGIAELVYVALAKSGIKILSDGNQFKGGRKLWVRLANRNDVKVLLLDEDNNKVEEVKNLKDYNDKRYWFFDDNFEDEEKSDYFYNKRFLLIKGD